MAKEKICKQCGRPIIFPAGTPASVRNPTKYHPECAEYHRALYQESWERGHRRRGRKLNAAYRETIAAQEKVIDRYRETISRLQADTGREEQEQEIVYLHQEVQRMRLALKSLGVKI